MPPLQWDTAEAVVSLLRPLSARALGEATVRRLHAFVATACHTKKFESGEW